jgi:replicative superfamily II helicase
MNKFRQRVNYGVKNELLSLMSLPSWTRPIARLQFNEGIEESDDHMQKSMEEIRELIGLGQDNLLVAEKLKTEAQRSRDFQQQSQAFDEEIRLAQFCGATRREFSILKIIIIIILIWIP